MSNIIEYKNYIGSVEYSNEDKCFFGKLEMVDDLVTFEATNVDELESNFKHSVDEYIETCTALNRDPQKTYKGVFNVRIDPALHKKIYKKALKEHISLNALIGKTLSESFTN
ncbi:MAG: type II toxin-antitoxin system HicB family antitoxin [Candidatus Thioglobus sp.]|uniref:type II toxin-antitoxin system HicB family antitoxin n=1 Tax=Candidatus Thioglobus sp. TaxID=2026721 RepID=UPI00261646E8|nr:type II toxin-antitoxin system HicB family antitoxin [Candidatus Thioglobus sp.]MDC9727635.1 type II toxin-antitoxin system HicB family antitoxin [Candidatus Thioglobus sp.]